MAEVGIVVVSHSLPLAEAATALAAQMLHGREIRIALAAGLDRTTLGTDATAIRDAILEVDGPDGVVVLMDLGSAVLSAELALDLLADDALRQRVVLSPAPLVEGLVAACVAAAGGAHRDDVATEAAGALLAKTTHLADSGDPSAPREAQTTRDDGAAGEAIARARVTNEHGLHARPAARIVAETGRFDAHVTVRNTTTGTGPVPATSLIRLATLAAVTGHELEFAARGPQARQAVEHLIALTERNFDDHEQTRSTPGAGDAAAATGLTLEAPRVDQAGRVGHAGHLGAARPLPASPGIAIGPLRRVVATPPVVRARDSDIPPGERLRRAIEQARSGIEDQRDRAAQRLGVDEAAIFDAHLALLEDPELLGRVSTAVSEEADASAAWSRILTGVEQEWDALADPYLRARAGDVRAVREEVLRALAGGEGLQPSGVGVLVAADLAPGDVATLDPEVVTGLLLAEGSPSSHAAIIARALGVPTVVAAGPAILALPEGTLLALDGGTGELYVDPDERVRADFTRRRADWAAVQARYRQDAAVDAVTLDGTPVAVLANLASPQDAAAAVAAGADGSGLVRTEFLFHGAAAAPDAREQESVYRAVLDGMHGRPVTFRTLDVGGDKPLTYLPVPPEQNPFLGLRGIRLTLARQELLREQLTALCRVARDVPLAVMFPMVSARRELLQALAVLDDAAGPRGRPPGMRVGMMIEVPAAALNITAFLPHLDFVSIGTNDLVQYTLAAERGNAAVADLADALDPAVLQLIDRVCQAATTAASPTADAPTGRTTHVSVCGDAAADPVAVPILLGLGVSSLSVPAPQVAAVKARVRTLRRDHCSELAAAALTADDAGTVRRLATDAPASTLP